MKNLIDNIYKTHTATADELISILNNTCCNEYLFFKADETRRNNVGDDVILRGLIEISNYCCKNCLYCGIRAENNNVKRYRMTIDEILTTSKKAIDEGFKTIVLQSGEDKKFPISDLVKIIKEIKKYDVAVTLSLGEMTYDEYKQLKDAGADRYLLRIETSDKDLYKIYHPNSSYENRVQCLKNLKKLGYETGTGCLVGLPEQTTESLANDILFFKEFDADMIGIGPLITHPETPLKDEKNGDFELALKVMALTRLLLPDINIPATTAMETIMPNGRKKALASGANVVMLNCGLDCYKSSYEIYPNKYIGR